jgi:hypothetical protein
MLSQACGGQEVAEFTAHHSMIYQCPDWTPPVLNLAIGETQRRPSPEESQVSKGLDFEISPNVSIFVVPEQL